MWAMLNYVYFKNAISLKLLKKLILGGDCLTKIMKEMTILLTKTEFEALLKM